MTYDFNPSTHETEIKASLVYTMSPGQPDLLTETLFWKRNMKQWLHWEKKE